MAFIKTYKKYLKVLALIWIICLVGFILAYLFLIGPQNELKKNIENKLVQGKQEYKRAQIAARYETQALINEEIGVLQNKLEEFVLDYKSAEDLTFDISKIANECSLSSFSVQSNNIDTISESSDPNNIFEKRIQVSFISGFQEFAVFLNTLERHKPVLFVHNFMLSKQNNSNTNYQVTLDLAALIRKQETTGINDENTTHIVGLSGNEKTSYLNN
ncbi:MAG: hypothetical protein JXA96_11750 [Sedimentisphaerales bacterium]|nr:hypothetical protein [Sedimentisphaerales bacterium]